MPAKIELVGKRFGKLRVRKDAPGALTFGGKKIRQSEVDCDCGKIFIARNIHLLSGHTTSCGCSRKDANVVHGHARRSGKTPTYYAWSGMISRCNNPKNKRYKNYGGRGIKVCREWARYENFRRDMGDRPIGLTLDRIDNDGNYTPKNCKWATWLEQNQHRSRDLNFTVLGVTGSLSLLCRHFGCSYTAALRRFHKGWAPEEAIFTAPGTRQSRYSQEQAVTKLRAGSHLRCKKLAPRSG